MSNSHDHRCWSCYLDTHRMHKSQCYWCSAQCGCYKCADEDIL